MDCTHPGIIHTNRRIDMEESARLTQTPGAEVTKKRPGNVTYSRSFGDPEWTKLRSLSSPSLGSRITNTATGTSTPPDLLFCGRRHRRLHHRRSSGSLLDIMETDEDADADEDAFKITPHYHSLNSDASQDAQDEKSRGILADFVHKMPSTAYTLLISRPTCAPDPSGSSLPPTSSSPNNLPVKTRNTAETSLPVRSEFDNGLGACVKSRQSVESPPTCTPLSTSGL
ncbi:hypothetical protein M422DRAFT_775562 [Sphaerobolus stellatus SS14]|nr:hypothetical protein M422DRAFT_775562 [Sphaerobolus stellatus SS14]